MGEGGGSAMSAQRVVDAIAEGVRGRKDKKATIEQVHEILKVAFGKGWKELLFPRKSKKLGVFLNAADGLSLVKGVVTVE